MKIVTWNAGWKFREKFTAIQQLKADVYVIQECEDPARCSTVAYREFTANGFWWGKNKNHGLGVFAAPHVCLVDNVWVSADLHWFGCVRVNDAFDLLGVWTNPFRRENRYYAEVYNRFHDLHAHQISSSTVVVGDFNCSRRWDADNNTQSYNTVSARLNAAGLCSAWHHHNREEPGKETEMTIKLHSNGRVDHIDYAFVAPERIRSCVIDASRDWWSLSDHRPVVLEVSEGKQGGRFTCSCNRITFCQKIIKMPAPISVVPAACLMQGAAHGICWPGFIPSVGLMHLRWAFCPSSGKSPAALCISAS